MVPSPLAGALAASAVLSASVGLSLSRRSVAVDLLASPVAEPPPSSPDPRAPHQAVGPAAPAARAIGSGGWLELAGRLGRTRPGRTLARGDDHVGRRLVLAGVGWTAETVGGMKVLTGGALGCLPLLAGVTGRGLLVLVPLLCLAGVRIPDVLLARRAKRRQRSLDGGVPDLAEFLVATVEAGLGPAVALQRSGPSVRGPLASELSTLTQEIELGVPWRDALQSLRDRTDAPSLNRLVTAVTRSQRLGTPIGPALRAVSAELRAERQARAEELARKAPVKMLFPLIFLILPAFLLLTLGPVLLATLRSLH
jgi:tight adherence protein C